MNGNTKPYIQKIIIIRNFHLRNNRELSYLFLKITLCTFFVKIFSYYLQIFILILNINVQRKQ